MHTNGCPLVGAQENIIIALEHLFQKHHIPLHYAGQDMLRRMQYEFGFGKFCGCQWACMLHCHLLTYHDGVCSDLSERFIIHHNIDDLLKEILPNGEGLEKALEVNQRILEKLDANQFKQLSESDYRELFHGVSSEIVHTTKQIRTKTSLMAIALRTYPTRRDFDCKLN